MRVILHVGAWKTGSSAIQLFLVRNRAALAARGLLMPDVVERENGHTLLFRALKTPGAARDEILAKLRAMGETSPDATVVLSSEHFWPLDAEEIASLAADLHTVSDDVSVLMYIRPQDEMWASIFAQQAKSFRVRPGTPVWGGGEYVGHEIRDWGLYYHRSLGMFADAFGRDAVTARLYRRDRFVGGDVIFDFLDFAGVGDTDALDRVEGDTNPSFGWKSVALSLWFVGAAYDAMREHTSLPELRRAFRAAVGDMYSRREDRDWLGRSPEVLDGAERRQIRQHYADDNAALFKDWFGGEDVFGPSAETMKVALDVAAMPEWEFDLARARLRRQFRRAGLNMAGREDVFRAPRLLSMRRMRTLFPPAKAKA